MRDFGRKGSGRDSGTESAGTRSADAVGKRTLVEGAQLRLKSSGPGKVTGVAARGVAEAAMAGPPQPLPHRADMEQQFGVSLGHVGAHTGALVESAGRSLGASAFALGDRVAFAEPTPSRGTVAHEVAHVLQQTRGGGAGDEVHDEAEARAAEGGAARAFDQSSAGGASAVRLQPAPQPAQDPAPLNAAAARQAIAFNKGRRLPAEAWTKIADHWY